jgi:hypothetical protein
MKYRKVMKAIRNISSGNTTSTISKFAILNDFEMLNVRGGTDSKEKTKTKEMDVYDTRED